MLLWADAEQAQYEAQFKYAQTEEQHDVEMTNMCKVGVYTKEYCDAYQAKRQMKRDMEKKALLDRQLKIAEACKKLSDGANGCPAKTSAK